MLTSKALRKVREHVNGERARKSFLEPYRSQEDERFNWLENEFLTSPSSWKQSIDNRGGNFTQNTKARMFLSWQTYEGIKITVNSLIEGTKFLLAEGFQYVLTERFCQDVVEEYFGRQRSQERRNDNPKLYQFGYNDNAIRVHCIITPVMGNTRGTRKGKRKPCWDNVDNTPLQKRKKGVN